MDISRRQKAVRRLLKEKEAILLVHYYQRGEIQDIADFLGDSLGLSIEAAKTKAKVIVFAGVHFMAESASILSPDKTVLLPRLDAGCPLADMITAEELEEEKKKYPGAAVVSYVNSSAAVKAKSDICCTSANAVEVVESLEGVTRVLMVPDGNLARYTARFTGKEIIPWRGYCPVHHFLTTEEVRSARERHPGAPFAAHPECREEVLDLADFVGSTSGIIRFSGETKAQKILIGTETGILHELKKRHPEKEFIPVSEKMVCATMRNITLEDIEQALIEMRFVVKVSDEVRIPAGRALSRMLDVRI
ncbi:MAG TPA: quinolinate synthase NadA [Syntrophales bacterium]|nr:quinolinate synthase NadA [Syntrophales bacterium]HQB31524.1 quinolinate synthase NadA [Syntrophales bacterium]